MATTTTHSVGDRVRIESAYWRRECRTGTVSAIDCNVHYDGSPAVSVTLDDEWLVWGHPSVFRPVGA